MSKDSKGKPLHIGAPRALDPGSDLIDVCYDGDFSEGVGLEAGPEAGTWAADVEAGEVFALPGSPEG